ncbi:hypothetical protein ACEWY4_010415 [Coilia grayii]|uniref:DNA topoisomerase n=1 Tax=Coilia grayii TaxID=363190 RepID=A0ABD1K1V6_9TELE
MFHTPAVLCPLPTAVVPHPTEGVQPDKKSAPAVINLLVERAKDRKTEDTNSDNTDHPLRRVLRLLDIRPGVQTAQGLLVKEEPEHSDFVVEKRKRLRRRMLRKGPQSLTKQIRNHKCSQPAPCLVCVLCRNSRMLLHSDITVSAGCSSPKDFSRPEEMNLEERTLITDLNKCDFGELHAMHKSRVEARKNMSKEEKQGEKDWEKYEVARQLKGRVEQIRSQYLQDLKSKQMVTRQRAVALYLDKASAMALPQPPSSVSGLNLRRNTLQSPAKFQFWSLSRNIYGQPLSDLQSHSQQSGITLPTLTNGVLLKSNLHSVMWPKQLDNWTFIVMLALRAGNEEEEGETADTVGCCSLRVEHITLHPMLDGQACVVEFDFLGEDSIRIYNKVPVSKRWNTSDVMFC